MSTIIGHAVSFWTWHSLCIGQGLSGQEAVEIMISAVLAAKTLPDPEPAQSPSRNPGD